MKGNNFEILDCTLRDGGLLNNFNFTDTYIREHIKMLSAANVDYIEVGYKTDQAFISNKQINKLKVCNDYEIFELTKGINNLSKLSSMIDYGKYNINQLAPAKESPFKMIRVACYLKDIIKVVEYAETVYKKGYKTAINIMAVSREKKEDLISGLRFIKSKCPFVSVYVVDSYGSLYPSETKQLIDTYRNELGDMQLGIHTHNNQQLAFANTIIAAENNVALLDATVNGMGRGVGNCPIELLIPYLNSKYKLEPVLQLIDNEFEKARKDLSWGYSTKNALTGIFNLHPIDSLEGMTGDLRDIYKAILCKDTSKN